MPLLSVPEGFADWLRTLLTKDPLSRFRRAADANWALLALPDPLEVDDDLAETTLSMAPMATLDLTWEGEERQGPELHTVPGVVDRSDIAPFAATWRRAQGQEAPPRLAGVGLGLWSLRHVPLVGRDEVRDRLWEHLDAARTSTRLVVLRGEVGTGKRRVARWLSERAHALGAAHVLAAELAQEDALSQMIARSLLCPELAGPELDERVEGMLARLGGQAEAAADLAKLISGAPQPADVRYECIAEHIALLSSYRPVLLRLEKLHLSMDAMGLVAQLLYGPSRPVLIVATVSDDALRDQPVESSMLDRLLQHPAAHTETLGPLSGPETQRLVRQLLGVRGELAARIEARCEGNPMVAVQLVGDWVERGVLVPTPAGFRLRGGEAAELPEDLHRMWRERTDRFLEARPETEAHMLELAAVLGVHVDTRLWRQVCRGAGLQVSLRFVEALIANGLAEAPDGGPAYESSFTHATLQESLVRKARDTGRHARWNLLAARVLGETGGNDALRGRHLMWGGARKAAITTLLNGASEWAVNGRPEDAMRALDDREALLRSLRVPEGDPRWGMGWAARASTALGHGDRDAAEAWSARLLEASQDHGWEDLEAEAERVRELLED
ncbi:MAG: AAA family ATPase [Proteobacteria bacterium]|nr:AAA family ATPase [Pseudomonadota bacterium]